MILSILLTRYQLVIIIFKYNLIFLFILVYIKHISSEANRICLVEGKKTITPEFIFKALKVFLINLIIYSF